MSQFAKSTTVSADKSRAEIESILLKYGASRFAYMTDNSNAVVVFEANNRRIKFVVPMPQAEAFRKFKRRSDSRTLSTRTDAQIAPLVQQSVRQRWRALLLTIKAKLEAIESNISSFEDEFLPHIVLPNGKTVGEWIQPQIQSSYESGQMPRALLGE